MKRKHSFDGWVVHCGLALSLTLGVHSASAQGTAIGYQGRLNDNGVPATGVFDFRFTVFDSIGNPGGFIAGPITNSATGVTNGLFNVALDFGAGVFIGPPRWLEIAVRTNGGNFTTLNPRQPVLATPYAIFAGTASNVVNGSVVKSLGGIKDDVLIQGGANVNITSTNNTITINSPGAAWSLNGNKASYNSGNVGIGTANPANPLTVQTAASSNGFEQTDGNVHLGSFIGPYSGGHPTGGWFGTYSNDKLRFFVNNGTPSITVDTDGYVGIDNDSPSYPLTVHSAINSVGIMNHAGTVQMGTYLGGATGGGYFGTISSHKLSFYTANSEARMTIDTHGHVGIGTTSPTAQLTVQTTGGGVVDGTTSYGFEHTDGNVSLSTYVASGSGPNVGGQFGTRSNHKLHFYVNDGLPCMTINTNERVGIGTTTPDYRLSLAGGPLWTAANWKSALGLENGAALGWPANGAGQRAGIGHSDGGLYLFRTTNNPATTTDSPSYDLVVSDTGNVGIGKTDPAQKLDVAGNVNVAGNASQDLDKGGLVKAMLCVDYDGTILRCYNSLQTGSATSTSPCGITVNHYANGGYGIDFGFPAWNRFISVTAGEGHNGVTFDWANRCARYAKGANANTIDVRTFVSGEPDDTINSEFMIIVY